MTELRGQQDQRWELLDRQEQEQALLSAALMIAGASGPGASLTTTEEFTGETTALNYKTLTSS
jgi:hypothetical protein